MRSPLRSILFAGIISIGLWFSFSFITMSFDDSSPQHFLTKKGSMISEKVSEFIRPPIKLMNRSVNENSDSVPLLPDSLSHIDTLLIAHKSSFRMSLFSKGKLLKTYVIALGQAPIGTKEKQGDNRTPEGDYKIIQKSRGPFEGDYSRYLGVAWMRLNYPNNADAINGLKKGLITEAQKNSIIAANNSGKEPPKNTKLGGGIGIHGWYGEWPEKDQQCLTWGCISVQNKDLDDLYNRVPVGTRIIILRD